MNFKKKILFLLISIFFICGFSASAVFAAGGWVKVGNGNELKDNQFTFVQDGVTYQASVDSNEGTITTVDNINPGGNTSAVDSIKNQSVYVWNSSSGNKLGFDAGWYILNNFTEDGPLGNGENGLANNPAEEKTPNVTLAANTNLVLSSSNGQIPTVTSKNDDAAIIDIGKNTLNIYSSVNSNGENGYCALKLVGIAQEASVIEGGGDSTGLSKKGTFNVVSGILSLCDQSEDSGASLIGGYQVLENVKVGQSGTLIIHGSPEEDHVIPAATNLQINGVVVCYATEDELLQPHNFDKLGKLVPNDGGTINSSNTALVISSDSSSIESGAYINGTARSEDIPFDDLSNLTGISITGNLVTAANGVQMSYPAPFNDLTVTSLSIPASNTYTLSNGQSLTVNGTAVASNDLNIEGTLTLNPDSNLTLGSLLDGTIAANGTLAVEGGTLTNNATGDGNGLTVDSFANGLTVSSGLVQNNGTINVGTADATKGQITISDSGQLINVKSTGVINIAETETASTIQVNGVGSNDGSLINNNQINNNGTISIGAQGLLTNGTAGNSANLYNYSSITLAEGGQLKSNTNSSVTNLIISPNDLKEGTTEGLGTNLNATISGDGVPAGLTGNITTYAYAQVEDGTVKNIETPPNGWAKIGSSNWYYNTTTINYSGSEQSKDLTLPTVTPNGGLELLSWNNLTNKGTSLENNIIKKEEESIPTASLATLTLQANIEVPVVPIQSAWINDGYNVSSNTITLSNVSNSGSTEPITLASFDEEDNLAGYSLFAYVYSVPTAGGVSANLSGTPVSQITATCNLADGTNKIPEEDGLTNSSKLTISINKSPNYSLAEGYNYYVAVFAVAPFANFQGDLSDLDGALSVADYALVQIEETLFSAGTFNIAPPAYNNKGIEFTLTTELNNVNQLDSFVNGGSEGTIADLLPLLSGKITQSNDSGALGLNAFTIEPVNYISGGKIDNESTDGIGDQSGPITIQYVIKLNKTVTPGTYYFFPTINLNNATQVIGDTDGGFSYEDSNNVQVNPPIQVTGGPTEAITYNSNDSEPLNIADVKYQYTKNGAVSNNMPIDSGIDLTTTYDISTAFNFYNNATPDAALSVAEISYDPSSGITIPNTVLNNLAPGTYTLEVGINQNGNSDWFASLNTYTIVIEAAQANNIFVGVLPANTKASSANFDAAITIPNSMLPESWPDSTSSDVQVTIPNNLGIDLIKIGNTGPSISETGDLSFTLQVLKAFDISALTSPLVNLTATYTGGGNTNKSELTIPVVLFNAPSISNSAEESSLNSIFNISPVKTTPQFTYSQTGNLLEESPKIALTPVNSGSTGSGTNTAELNSETKNITLTIDNKKDAGPFVVSTTNNNGISCTYPNTADTETPISTKVYGYLATCVPNDNFVWLTVADSSQNPTNPYIVNYATNGTPEESTITINNKDAIDGMNLGYVITYSNNQIVQTSNPSSQSLPFTVTPKLTGSGGDELQLTFTANQNYTGPGGTYNIYFFGSYIDLPETNSLQESLNNALSGDSPILAKGIIDVAPERTQYNVYAYYSTDLYGSGSGSGLTLTVNLAAPVNVDSSDEYTAQLDSQATNITLEQPFGDGGTFSFTGNTYSLEFKISNNTISSGGNSTNTQITIAPSGEVSTIVININLIETATATNLDPNTGFTYNATTNIITNEDVVQSGVKGIGSGAIISINSGSDNPVVDSGKVLSNVSYSLGTTGASGTDINYQLNSIPESTVTSAIVGIEQSNTTANGNTVVGGTLVIIPITPTITYTTNNSYVGVADTTAPTGGPTSPFNITASYDVPNSVATALGASGGSGTIASGDFQVNYSINGGTEVTSIGISDFELVSGSTISYATATDPTETIITLNFTVPTALTSTQLGEYDIIINKTGSDSKLIVPVNVFFPEETSICYAALSAQSNSGSPGTVSYDGSPGFSFKNEANDLGIYYANSISVSPNSTVAVTSSVNTSVTPNTSELVFTPTSKSSDDLTFDDSPYYALVNNGGTAGTYTDTDKGISVNDNSGSPAYLYGYVAEISVLDDPVTVAVQAPSQENAGVAVMPAQNVQVIVSTPSDPTSESNTIDTSNTTSNLNDTTAAGQKSFLAECLDGQRYEFLYWLVYTQVDPDVMDQITEDSTYSAANVKAGDSPYLGVPTKYSQNPLTLSINSNTVLEPVFIDRNFVAKVTLQTSLFGSANSAGGAIKFNNIWYQPDSTVSVYTGSNFDLQATSTASDNNYKFQSWTVTPASTIVIDQNPGTFKAGAASTITANYSAQIDEEPEYYNLNLSQQNYPGIVNFNVGGTNVAQNGPILVSNQGATTVAVSNVDLSKYSVSWQATGGAHIAGSGSGSSVNVTMTGPGSLVAIFTEIPASGPTTPTGPETPTPSQVNITTTVQPTGSGTVTGAGSYNSGTTVKLEALPSNGYVFQGWYVGNSQISSQNPYSFTAVNDVNVIAKFVKATEESPEITLNPTSLTLDEGETGTVQVTLNPQTTLPVSVSSNNQDVATVSYDPNTGKITVTAGTTPGTATITVSCGESTKTFTVTIGEEEPSEFTLTLSPDPVYLSTEGLTSVTLNGTINPSEGYDLSAITYQVSPSSVASVSGNGTLSPQVTALAEGQATITAYYNGQAIGSATINVSNEPVICDGIVATAQEADYFTLTAVNVRANPAINATGQVEQVAMFTWSTSNQSDMQCKRAVNMGDGNWSWSDFKVNDLNEYYINGDRIIANVYASLVAGENGNMIGGLTYKNVNNMTANGYTTGYIAYSQDIAFDKPTVLSGSVSSDYDLNNVDNYSGTTGIHRQMEGVRISSNVDGVSVNTAVHVENIGWVDPVGDGTYAGTMHRNLQIESMKLTLSGDQSSLYTIQYRVHQENVGWSDWYSDGEEAGITGQHLQLEAYQVRILRKSQ